MNETDFDRMKTAAAEQMRAMSARAANRDPGGNLPPVPPFVRLPHEHPPASGPKQEPPRPAAPPPSAPPLFGNLFSGKTDLPFLDRLRTDGDLSLLLGLLLILVSEQADKRLLFALLYILL